MKSLLTTISILFFQIQISAQAYDIYSDMGRSLPDIYYLHQYGEFESDKIQDILTSFETINFKEVKLDSFYAASIHSIEGEFLELSSYENRNEGNSTSSHQW